MSTFAWLDYSEHERRQAMEVLDLFGEDDTRDELGLGTLRDAFADALFPGTSTIQTRAKYFLFVPWVYRDEIEHRGVSGSVAAARARDRQDKLRRALTAGGEEIGVIGFRAGLNVQRLPASVYWFGLRRWGILTFEGSEDDYRRGLDAFYRRVDGAAQPDAGESIDPVTTNWDRHLPAPPSGWLMESTFALTPVEADYLSQRIIHAAPHSLLAHLLLSRQAIGHDEAFPWDVRYAVPLSAALADRLEHARNFSELMHGAALLYNLLLAEQQAGGAHAEHYRERLGEWWARLESRRGELLAWDRAAFWRVVSRDLGARVRGITRLFVDRWLSLALDAASIDDLIGAQAARRLVIDQEQAVKPGRARVGNHRATENWEGASGSAQLSYRWTRPVRGMVNDILAGLGVGPAAGEAARA